MDGAQPLRRRRQAGDVEQCRGTRNETPGDDTFIVPLLLKRL